MQFNTRENKRRAKDKKLQEIRYKHLANNPNGEITGIPIIKTVINKPSTQMQMEILQMHRVIGNDALRRNLDPVRNASTALRSNSQENMHCISCHDQTNVLQPKSPERISYKEQLRAMGMRSKKIQFDVKDFQGIPANLAMDFMYIYDGREWGTGIRWWHYRRTGKCNTEYIFPRKSDITIELYRDTEKSRWLIGQQKIPVLRPRRGDIKLNIQEEKTVLNINASDQDKARAEAARILNYPQTKKVKYEWFDVKTAGELEAGQYRWEIHAPTGFSVAQV
jgi:hypothetical protein